MTVKFQPTGFLDVATDPSLLPFQLTNNGEISGSMTRLKNMDTTENGVAKTRKGSVKINGSPVDQTNGYFILELNGDRYLFAGTKIYKNETSIATNLTSAQWSAIVYNAYNVTTQSIFAINGTNRKRITNNTVYEWGIDAPIVAPTIAGIDKAITYAWEAQIAGIGTTKEFTISGGSFNYVYPWEGYYQTIQDRPDIVTGSNYGTFYFDNNSIDVFGMKYTYCRKNGDTLECESNPSPASTMLQESGIKITWTAPTDTQVTHVRIYRTLAGGSVYYFDKEYIKTSYPVALTTSDESLGSALEYDHDRPPLGKVVIGPAFNGICFILKDNLLYYSKANRPEYWPATNYLEIGSPQFELTGAVFANGSLYVSNRHEIYSVQGTGAESFFPYPTNAATGAISFKSMINAKGEGILHYSSDGIWLFNGTVDKKITENRFNPLFNGETINGIPGINSDDLNSCWLYLFKLKLYFIYPGGILITNMQTEKTAYYDYGRIFIAIGYDSGNDRIMAVDTSGYIWALESGTDDNGTAISWEIESKAYTDSLSKYFPRYAKYDINLDSGSVCNGYILLNDAIKQTHNIVDSRKTVKRHIIGCTGDRLGIRVSGSGGVAIRQIEIE